MADGEFAGFEPLTLQGIEQGIVNLEELEARTQQRAAEADPFAGFERLTPGPAPTPSVTPGEAVSAFARRGTGAALQTGFTLAGAVMGGQIGALGGPFAPVTIPAGVIVGGVAGFLFGDTLAELGEVPGLTVNSLEDLPVEQRPYGAAGEVVGGSVPFMGAPIMAAAQGIRLPASMAGNQINKIITSAGRAPGAFVATEMAATNSAAIASGLVEAASPNSPGTRAVAEIGAGILNPIRLTSGLIRRAGSSAVNFVKQQSPAGRRTAAGQLINGAVVSAGEDPEAILRILGTVDPSIVPGPPPTAAIKSGSRALAQLQQDLSAIDQQFGADMARQAGDALEATTRAIAVFRGTGDPTALRIAADLRSDQFRTMLQYRLAAADAQLQKAANAITVDTPAARADLSRQGKEIIDDVITRVRAVERELWGDIPGETALGPAGAESVLRRFSKLKGEILERKKFPDIVEGTIKDLMDAKSVLSKQLLGETVDPKVLAVANKRLSIGNMLKLRSELLQQAREASRAGKFDDARIFGELAEGILDDLSRAGTNEVGTTIDTARRFSRELNEVFTRTFVGKATASGARGTELVPPEVLLQRAFATGKEMGDMQMLQLEEATRFLADRGRGTPIDLESIEIMMQAQERIIRLVAAQTVKRNPATQVVTGVDSVKLRAFMKENEDILTRFPEARQLMEDAIQTDAGREALIAQVTRARTFAKKTATISRVLGVENPIDAVRGALKSRQPLAQLRGMITLAKRSGPDAMDGLRAAMWEDAFRSATNPGGGISFPHLLSAIDDPIRPGLPSLRQLMREEGLLTTAESNLVEQLVDRIQRIRLVDAAAPTGGLQEGIGEADAVIDLMLRVSGSRVGTFFAGGQTGPQLIAAGAGSRFARNVLAKVPKLRIRDLVAAALRGDPITPGAERFSLLRALMKEGVLPGEIETSFRQIHAYGIQAGFLATGTYEIEGERQ